MLNYHQIMKKENVCMYLLLLYFRVRKINDVVIAKKNMEVEKTNPFFVYYIKSNFLF